MNYENLWEDNQNNNTLLLTDNIHKIMKEQIHYLKAKTNNKVLAKFYKAKNINKYASIISSLANLTSTKLSNPTIQNDSIADEEEKQLLDANLLYTNEPYNFEIYTNEYKYRVFEITLSPVYPINLKPDLGIHNEINNILENTTGIEMNINNYTIHSESSLLMCLKYIFTSKKVKYLLLKLQENAETN